MPWAWGCAEGQRELVALPAGKAAAPPGYTRVPGDCLQGCGVWLMGLGVPPLSLFQLLLGEGLGLGCSGHKARSIRVCLEASMVCSLGSGKTYQNTCVLAEG